LGIKPVFFRILAFGWLVLTLTLLLLPGDSLPSEPIIPFQDKVAHFVLFAGYAFLWILGFVENMWASRNITLIIILIGGLFIAVSSELIQEAIPGRRGDLFDFFVDLIGLITGYVIGLFFEKRNHFGNV
jgi:VanZ family protein